MVLDQCVQDELELNSRMRIVSTYGTVNDLSNNANGVILVDALLVKYNFLECLVMNPDQHGFELFQKENEKGFVVHPRRREEVEKDNGGECLTQICHQA